MTGEQAVGKVAFSAGVGDRAGKHKSIMELDHGVAGSSRVVTGDDCEKDNKITSDGMQGDKDTWSA